MKHFVLLLTGLLMLTSAFTQDVDYARKMLKKLTSNSLRGRGYVRQGDKKAADFIVSQLKKKFLLKFANNYFQTYSFPINTFPYKLKASIDGKKLQPGEDYVVSCSSPTIIGNFPLLYLPDTLKNTKELYGFARETEKDDYFLVVNDTFKKIYGTSIDDVKGVILLSKKQPYWQVSNGGKVAKTSWLKIKAIFLRNKPDKINLNIKNKFETAHQTQNIIAYVKGKRYPDTFLVFSAHYDHLGTMGKRTVYHGANDNGSGTSMLLNLAGYYSQPKNHPTYSIAFLFFSGEEAGLKGSRYYVEHPVFPLKQIKLLINLDMVGTGSEGITIINGKIYPELFTLLSKINDKHHFVVSIKARGKACNSDHCSFYEKGVPSVFIYTRGPEHRQYHIPEDDMRHFPFTAYNGLFRLLTDYVKTIEF